MWYSPLLRLCLQILFTASPEKGILNETSLHKWKLNDDVTVTDLVMHIVSWFLTFLHIHNRSSVTLEPFKFNFELKWTLFGYSLQPRTTMSLATSLPHALAFFFSLSLIYFNISCARNKMLFWTRVSFSVCKFTSATIISVTLCMVSLNSWETVIGPFICHQESFQWLMLTSKNLNLINPGEF